MRQRVAALSQSTALCERPERVELLGVQLDLLLLPGEAGAPLDGQQQVLSRPPKPDLPVLSDGEVALLDRLRVACIRDPGSSRTRNFRSTSTGADVSGRRLDWADQDRGARGQAG